MNKIDMHNSIIETTLTLLQTKGLGRKTSKSILDVLWANRNETGQLFEMSNLHAILCNKTSINKSVARFKIPDKFDLEKGNSNARKIISESEKLGLKIIDYYDDIFPNRLRSLSDAPLILFAMGNEKCLLSNNSVAVVGTRKPSDYGSDVARRIGLKLARNQIVVISGLAEGIDAAAHRGCVDGPGQTIAVLAHGLKSIYPASNRNLAGNIVEKNGCLISEYPPSEKPTRYSFVDRDRLQSGLSAAVLVVETAEKGGTMHTVKFCIDQGRMLWAVANHLDKANANYVAGFRKLMDEYGAKSIYWDNDREVEAFIKAIRAEDFKNGKEILRRKSLEDYY
jgi:DNA processing protein